MAWFQVSFGSANLKRMVNANVLIPGMDARMAGMPLREEKPYKTLYLLHGYSGDYTDWLTNTALMEMSQMNDIAIVMPSGENSFYVDIERSGRMYSEFIGRELVDFTRRVFPLSSRREDTIIGGLSMGGYGALYNGLKHHDVFAHVIALSSALIVETAPSSTYEPNMMGTHRGYFEEVFGDLDKLLESDKNLEVLAKQVLDKGGNLPDLYIACGWNDMLVYGNRKFSSYLNDIGFKHVYEEGAGTHEWAFWNNFLKRGLERLELKPKMPPMTPPFWVDAESDSPNPVVL
ncbi:MAG: alpha/beta hydrolase-fold protein [Oscillospiraceae bacterium]|nr:alpha/beta hydrolase-fold protein [Oscillospiraceae bacterium]